MATPMQTVFTVSTSQPVSSAIQGSGSVWVNPGQSARSPTYSTYATSQSYPNFWALVLDRANPTQPALFNQPLANNTDVPDNLANLMTPSSLLFFYATNSMYAMPQGDLYAMLATNGGGPLLETAERFAYYNGCGMVAPTLYMLVSVPGSGMAGIEEYQCQRYTRTNVDGEPYPQGWSYPHYSLLLNLAPSTSGYVPVKVGGVG